MLQRAPLFKNEPFLYFWGKDEVDLNTGLEVCVCVLLWIIIDISKCNHRFLGSSKADTVVSTNRLGAGIFLNKGFLKETIILYIWLFSDMFMRTTYYEAKPIEYPVSI